MDNQYPGNSDRGQEQAQQGYQKRVSESVINGSAKVNEKTLWNNIEEFFGLGECKSFRDYVGALSDMTNRVYGAIDTLLGNRKYQNTTVPAARVQYSACYNNPVQPAPAQPQQNKLDGYGPYYITYDQRQDAEVVLMSMIEILKMYTNVSIGDMFDLAGLTDPHGYTNQKYGWTGKDALDGVRVIPFGSKWVINVPPAIPI